MQASSREDLIKLIFRRRTPQRPGLKETPVSPLAAIADRQFEAVWRAPVLNFGMPQEVRIEAALPASRKVPANPFERAQLSKRLAEIGRPPTRESLLRANLFMRQEDASTGLSACPMTGAAFSFADAFSPKIEMAHLVPVAKNRTGGKRNLILCLADANRAKGAFGQPAEHEATPPDRLKKVRAGIADADALRQAVSLAVKFLREQTDVSSVRLVSPRSVSLARRQWLQGESAKDRSDLRHHAFDAILLGVLPDGKVSENAPIESICAVIDAATENIVVSTKPEHAIGGQMHDDTRYGRPSPHSGFNPQSNVCARKPVSELTGPMLKRIAAPHLREQASVLDATRLGEMSPVFGRAKRVKIIRVANDAIELPASAGRPDAVVPPFDNHHLDIVQMRDGGWKAFGASRRAVAQRGWRPD
jgi:CRISPR-associated endonuclease Csn1